LAEYENHNYVKEKLIKERINRNEIDEKDMSEYLYQKIYFKETYAQYPTMRYNQILLSMIEKYKVKKVLYNNNNFNVFKNAIKKKQYNNLTIEDKLDNIKLLGKELMISKLEYIDINIKIQRKILEFMEQINQ
jgi:hypothetical protein